MVFRSSRAEMMPSPTQNPTASSKSLPGVRIVTASASGSSPRPADPDLHRLLDGEAVGPHHGAEPAVENRCATQRSGVSATARRTGRAPFTARPGGPADGRSTVVGRVDVVQRVGGGRRAPLLLARPR